MLAAKSMGYDSCPMDGFDFDEVSKLIRLPEGHVISLFVAIGKALAPAQPRGGQLDMNEVVISDRFS
jgi:nitroreductase